MERVDARPGAGCATFDDVLAHHQADIYRFGVHLTRDRGEADNLYQETLAKAFHAFDEIDGPASCRAWLFTIATTTFLGDRRRRGSERSGDAEQAAEVQGTSPGHTDRLDSHTLLREVEAGVATLPPHQWVALVQRLYFDLGYAEIAATLCCTEAVARAHVHEALRALRTRIGDRL
jgi:RNA polymerase sigma-70 factor, ECF subfamily